MSFGECVDCGELRRLDEEDCCEECAANYEICDSCLCVNRPEHMNHDSGFTLCNNCYN